MVFMLEEFILLNRMSRIGKLNTRTLIAVLIGCTMLCGFAVAHAPSDVEVNFNELTGDLAVTITHQVDNPTTHYVKQITVRQGTTVHTSTSYTSQPDRSSFTYNFNLPKLKEAIGEITVDTQCNQFGSRSGTLMLTRTQGPPDALVSSDMQQMTPLSTKAGALPLVVVLAVGFAARKILR